MAGQRIDYVRVRTFEQTAQRQLDEIPVDRIFTDRASGKDTHLYRRSTPMAKGSLYRRPASASKKGTL